MDAENRTIKEEASNEGGSGGETRDDVDCGAGDTGTGSNISGENQEEEIHHHAKTIYSLNMNVCRLCLSEGHGQLQPVFYAQDTPDEILQQKILDLTTVEITYASDFPTGVCIDCLAKLDEYSLFRRQCIDNNEILKLKYFELRAIAETYCKQEEEEVEQLQVAPLREHHKRLPGVKKEEGFVEKVESGSMEEELGNSRRVRGGAEDVGEMEEEQQQPRSPYVPFVDDGAETEIIIGEGDGDADAEENAGRQRVVAAGTKIQYVCEDGTMAEYVTSGAIVRRECVGEMMEEPPEEHEVYYTVGTDTYAIQTNAEGYPNAANYVPQGFENQTEIECTTIEEHLPEEYVEVEQQQASPSAGVTPGSTVSATVVTSRGLHDRPFVCKHCKTSFKYEHNYDRHMKNHAKVLYRCSKCSKTFVKLRKCQQHFVKAHSSQRYECDICFRTYSLPTRLENHVIEMHSVNGVYACDRCQGEMFSSYLDFKAHRMRYHPRTNDTGGGGSDTTAVPTIIKQTAYGDVVHMQQVLTLNPQALASSVSPTASSDGCEMEDAQDEPIANTKPSKALPVEERKRSSGAGTNRAAAAPSITQRARRTNGRTAANRSGKGQRGASKQQKPAPVVQQQVQQEVILIDDDEHHPNSVVESPPPGGSVLMLHTNGGATTTECAHASATVHRELLQQIEESEANASGPKVYPCRTCTKTFVHLNNLKAHIYAEHDNDKPFKCKQCPISFKTKEILVMHMLLHAQNNSAT